MSSYASAVSFTRASPTANYTVVIEVGEIPISIKTNNLGFVGILQRRYGAYIKPASIPQFSFEVDLIPPDISDPEAQVKVWMEAGEWRLERGDFEARWNSGRRVGWIRQSPNPYSIDAVLRIVHTLILAEEGGFLLHAASAVRSGNAFLFSGVSGAGKTTISRLAPADVALLTDEASYIRRTPSGYKAYGTPFAGELGKPGKDISAQVKSLFLLHKAETNYITPLDPAEAVRRLMRNILFFSHDEQLVKRVFDAACAFVATVPVHQLSFFPEQRVWDLVV